jgi:sigma-B regulation protein RsbU (phosphoserine phosphatase)
VRRANELFRQSTLPTQYATLVCGKTTSAGDLEIVNAGHLPALLMKPSDCRIFESTGQPLGLFASQEFIVDTEQLRSGDTLVVYTDGISEAENDGGDEYGLERLRQVIEQSRSECPNKLIDACKQHLNLFRGGCERFDDETMLAIQYTPGATMYQPARSAVV